MKIAVIGSGGREHSICSALKKSENLNELYCIPGNGGTSEIAKNIKIDINDFQQLKNFILDNKIDLVVIGPEKPLVDGLTDYLKKFNIKVFGPNKQASQLEGSKIFTKKICEKENIPTAKFGVFENKKDSISYIKKSKFPIVIKADNIAAGKGVYISNNLNEGIHAINEIFDGKFGAAHNVLIEEFLEGEEMSFFIITDGVTIKEFGTAQDHKRVSEGDKGKNTGGMGCYSPSRLINDELKNKILNQIINPTLKALSEKGVTYSGFLYAGLMIKDNNPYLVEYNVRMGDPECQTILPNLKSDLAEIFFANVNKKLKEIKIEWKDKKSLCVVLCSNGYPDEYKKNIEIKNLEKLKLDDNNIIFHAGTKIENFKTYATGGRVLNFVSLGDNFNMTKKDIYSRLEGLNWEHGFYRKDIGHKIKD
jgi:phosphoribosylamine--glycine ligase